MPASQPLNVTACIDRQPLSAFQVTIVVLCFLIVAVDGFDTAAIGFIATLMTGNERYSYWAGAIAVVVFIYSYPTKSSWLKTMYRFTDKA